MDTNFHPSRSFRYCPKCGSLGTFDESNNSFKCPRCGFNFYLNSAAAVTGLIFDKEGKLLMVRRALDPAKGMLDLPGGFVNPGESVEKAIARELKEELGVEPSHISFFASFPNEYLFSGTLVYTVDLVFSCTIDDFEQIKANDDVASIEFRFVSEINADEIPFISVRNLIQVLNNM